MGRDPGGGHEIMLRLKILNINTFFKIIESMPETIRGHYAAKIETCITILKKLCTFFWLYLVN